ncbi:hypothetical protein CJJ23_00320 [Mycoplasmopsis agassizii]|uniref:Lipoprotein n=1 Tax=Mycoplasmopsis agassizii TaxID=33922 RepID=A0A269TL35_9BACT|nr:hypothetical protein [Mycoplasmopsis agassizii]PAK21776.1 hypothetical protein CJJ23_00320 [Mycoplasmopsis agassizii]
MLFNKKILLTLVLPFTAVLLTFAVSCSSITQKPKDEPIDIVQIKPDPGLLQKPVTKETPVQDAKMNLKNQLSKLELDSKKIEYFSFNETIAKMLSSESFGGKDIIILKSKSELTELFNNWKKYLIKKFYVDEKTEEKFSISKAEFDEILVLHINELNKKFDNDYFQKNFIFIDFGGEISPIGENTQYYINNQSVINNLTDVFVKDNKIVVSYDTTTYANNDIKYGTFYSLDRISFDLKDSDYKIEKRGYDRNKATPISNRMLAISSFITQDLSKYQTSENNEWTTNKSFDKFSSILLKTKQQLSDLLNKFSLYYQTKYSKEFPVSKKEAILSTYNDSYFEQNYLVLISAFHYPATVKLFSDNIEKSFDVKIDNSEIIFTIFKSLHVVTGDETDQDYVEFMNESKDPNKMKYGPGNQQHTLFFKIPKNLIANEEKLKVSVDYIRTKYN